MPSKKKTNYISYEIKKLEKYFKQLEKYMDDNPPDEMVDRVEMLESTRGNPIMKVIATKEQQIKLFKDTLKEMPSLLENLNKLRMTVDGDEVEDEVRGGRGVPGFMRNKNGKKTTDIKKKPEQVEINEEFDEDPMEEDNVKEQAVEEYESKLLLPGPEEEPEEEEELDPWEEE
jgi:hypothetical protein